MLNDKEFRAKQFLPFSALKGFAETIRNIEKIGMIKKDLSSDYKNNLDQKIKRLKKGDVITIKYYSGIEYVETTGTIKFIDEINKSIYLSNSIILFDDIIEFNE